MLLGEILREHLGTSQSQLKGEVQGSSELEFLWEAPTGSS